MVEKSGSTVTETVNYTYNSLDKLTGLTDGSGNLIAKYTYNNSARLLGSTRGTAHIQRRHTMPRGI